VVELRGSTVERPAGFELVTIAASAGGVQALTIILEGLPSDFPIPLAIVQHVSPRRDSFLAHILGRRSKLTVRVPDTGDRLMSGTAYIAPPDLHMTVAAGLRVSLTHTEAIHFLRPSADRLFESAATALGPVIGVILTGTGSDGSSGARAIKIGGGIVIAQDQKSSDFFGMPQSAIRSGVVDLILPLTAIAPMLNQLARS
jgi:two-component system chemotaxis response regulator CheB